MRFHDESKCELRYGMETKCRGAIKRIAAVKLCHRHRQLVKEIQADAARFEAILKPQVRRSA